VKIILLVGLSLLAGFSPKAQHCPYDGSYMIAVYLVDKQGKPKTSATGLFLKEKQNPTADSCTYAEGQLRIAFDHASVSLMERYDGWETNARKRSEGADFLNEGYYVVVLNMSQKTCMIKQGSSFKYTPRVFNIEINGVAIDVPQESIYALCTDAGNWDRIGAITVMTE
jgi:hypothetical protein